MSIRATLISLTLFAAQLPTLQDKPVIHLRPHQDSIPASFGGNVVMIANGPSVVRLPGSPPLLDTHRKPWVIDVRNLGPGAVTVVGNAQFNVKVELNHTVEIQSSGNTYSIVRP